MFTNTYTPHRGGVARSVESFTRVFRDMGHRVLVVAPEFENSPADESEVIRIPSIQHFNGSDFSVHLPIVHPLSAALHEFQPGIIHSHHPFLLGDAAQRAAARLDIPLIFTHHTLYENYTHNLPIDSPAVRRFAVELPTGYANLCDQVIVPSESIADLLASRGVTAPIAVVPTGVDLREMETGDGQKVRAAANIPDDAFVIGHLGRLASEKNLPFLSRAVLKYLSMDPSAIFLVVGEGPLQKEIESILKDFPEKVRFYGPASGREIVDAYHAMDLFVFASHTETQGLVLSEALAAGIPIVAVDASGVREVVTDEVGRLIDSDDEDEFARAIGEVKRRRDSMKEPIRKQAEKFSLTRSSKRMIEVYDEAIERGRVAKHEEEFAWSGVLRMVEREWNLLCNMAHSASIAMDHHS